MAHQLAGGTCHLLDASSLPFNPQVATNALIISPLQPEPSYSSHSDIHQPPVPKMAPRFSWALLLCALMAGAALADALPSSVDNR